jgi:DNA-binding SARP family transcriptional activator
VYAVPALSDPPGATIRLQLLGSFSLAAAGKPIAVGACCQRLLAMVALNGRKIRRRRAAGLLWPDADAARANANLRSVLWRLQQSAGRVLEPSLSDLHLANGIEVDIHIVAAVARRVIDRSVAMEPGQLSAALRSNLYEDLQPEMDDNWLVAERTRHRQLRLQALEILSERFASIRWFGAAVDAGLAAVGADPFRESAHQALIQAYLAEGNQHDACQQFRVYQRVVRDELGLEPSERLHDWLPTSERHGHAGYSTRPRSPGLVRMVGSG